MSELDFPVGVYGALAKAQAEFPPITRDRTVTVQTKNGGSYRFAYAPLDSIMDKVRPVLAQNGLAIAQTFGASSTGAPQLETILAHEDGSTIRGALPLPVSQGQSAQELGSLITYCRRYSVVAILGLATEEDDDANTASGNTVQQARAGSQNGGDGQVSDPHGLAAARADADVTKPEDVVLHFSKNKGKRLGDLSEKQLAWYADGWTPNPDFANDQDALVKAAAQALAHGPAALATATDDDIPF